MARCLFRSVWLIANLLPHLHGRDCELGRLRLPSWEPLILPGQEILGRSLRLVDPRFAGRSILKPPISTSNSQVDDEVELLVERRIQVGIVDPRVGKGSAIGVG